MPVVSRLLHVAFSATLGTALVLPSGEEAKNPLLTRYGETLAPWEAIEVRHIVPAVRKHLGDAKKDFKALEEKVSKPGFKPSYENLVVPYRLLGEPLDKAYHIANHLKSVRDSKELREAINEVRPDVIDYSEGVGQSHPLYSAFKALSEDKEAFAHLTAAQKREVEQELQSFEMSGVGLDNKTQEEFNNISQRLSILSNTFSENVLDSTKAWRKLVGNSSMLKGLPEAPLQLAAEAAKREAESLRHLPYGSRAANATLEEGPYLLTLDGPTAGAVMTYVEDADVRKEVYIASASMASELNGPDNTDVIKEILSLRQREAEILGFKTYAEMSMQRKMATVESAGKLLEDLRATAYPKAIDDLNDLKSFAKSHGATGELKHWDASYWSHKQTKEKFDIDAEELRPYFPLDSALDGLFGLAGKMLGVKVTPAKGPKWHKDVLLFEVRRNAGDKEPTALLYMDLFARPSEKRAGGWQMSLQDYDAARGKKPVSVIVTSFRPPVGDKPALLSFGEVHTLFHEFGHASQAMLTTQEEPAFAGISGVEWDAVELPSQFMEYWLDEAAAGGAGPPGARGEEAEPVGSRRRGCRGRGEGQIVGAARRGAARRARFVAAHPMDPSVVAEIDRLNGLGQLGQQIHKPKVAKLLSQVGATQALEILSGVLSNEASVSGPDTFINQACWVIIEAAAAAEAAAVVEEEEAEEEAPPGPAGRP